MEKKNQVSAPALMREIMNVIYLSEKQNGDKYEYIKNNKDNLFKNIKELDFDILSMTESELESFGFCKWDDSNLMLIPLWLYPFIPQGIVLTSIDGKKYITGQDEINDEYRFGCLSYGVYPIPEDTAFKVEYELTFTQALEKIMNNKNLVMVDSENSNNHFTDNEVYIKWVGTHKTKPENKNDKRHVLGYPLLSIRASKLTVPWTATNIDMAKLWNVYDIDYYLDKCKEMTYEKMKQRDEYIKKLKQTSAFEEVKESLEIKNHECNCDGSCTECHCKNTDK